MKFFSRPKLVPTMSRALLLALTAGIAMNTMSSTALASKGSPLLVPVSYDAPVTYKKKGVSKKSAKKSAAAVAPAASTEKPADKSADKSGEKSGDVKVALPANYFQRHSDAMDRALRGDTKGALKILNDLAGLPLPHDELDRVYLSLGRVYYGVGNDSQALDNYLQVRTDGPSWLEALEERAYVYMRLGQPEEAIASLKTVLSPIFKDRVLTEPYFVASLAQLRVCDYKSLFATLELFKTRYRDRIKGWESSNDSYSKLRLKEASETIQKLNLVEAEAIQYVYMDESGKRMGGRVPSIQRRRDQLTFPMDANQETKEVWLDEVDDFKVSAKGCPTSNFGRVAAQESK